MPALSERPIDLSSSRHLMVLFSYCLTKKKGQLFRVRTICVPYETIVSRRQDEKEERRVQVDESERRTYRLITLSRLLSRHIGHIRQKNSPHRPPPRNPFTPWPTPTPDIRPHPPPTRVGHRGHVAKGVTQGP